MNFKCITSTYLKQSYYITIKNEIRTPSKKIGDHIQLRCVKSIIMLLTLLRYYLVNQFVKIPK